MTQSYRNEIRDATIDTLQSLLDITGYHFVWCPAYGHNTACNCGMAQMMAAKARLEAERLEEFSLWQEALGNG